MIFQSSEGLNENDSNIIQNRFIPPGSVRVKFEHLSRTREIESVAFMRPDGGFAVVFLNE